jgi:hypothetical protein
LNAKLNACVGKYRTMFAMFPRQNEPKPCSAETRVKQLTMPVYLGTSPDMICATRETRRRTERRARRETNARQRA